MTNKHFTQLIIISFLISGTLLFPSLVHALEDPYQQALVRLNDKDPGVRRQAAEQLGSLRNPDAVNDLLNLLSDKITYVRRAAIDSLGLLRSRAASRSIASILETDNDPQVRQTAAIALGYISDPSTIPSLIKGMKDPHEGTRYACINSIGILRDSVATEALIKELKNTDSRVRTACAYALGNIKDIKAVPELIQALKISRSTATENIQYYDAATAATIVRTLGLIPDPSSIAALKPFLKDKDKKVRLNTALALSKLKDGSGAAVARQHISDSDIMVRQIAAEILGEQGDAEDLKLLKTMQTDGDVAVQRVATQYYNKLFNRISPPPIEKPTNKKQSEKKSSQ